MVWGVEAVGSGIGQLQPLSVLWAKSSQGLQDFQQVRPRHSAVVPPAFTAGLRKRCLTIRWLCPVTEENDLTAQKEKSLWPRRGSDSAPPKFATWTLSRQRQLRNNNNNKMREEVSALCLSA